MPTILAADIGGTNARFARFEAHGPGGLFMEEAVWLPTASVASFEDLLEALEDTDFGLSPRDADAVAVALAGPVRGLRCNPPNIPWSVDLTDAGQRLGWRRYGLINDFAAQAWACRSPVADLSEEVLPGTPDPGGVTAVLGAGTGLGMALLAPDAHGGFMALPTEGGHATFPFQGPEECAFQDFLRRRTGRELVIGDMVLTGSGLSALHAFLTGRDLEPGQVAAELAGAAEHPATPMPTLEWFARLYGRVARNLALSCLALGGVFVSGGLAARNPALVRHPCFGREFRFSETHASLLADIPVRLNREEDSGLWGAAFMARTSLLDASVD